jgi:hypothetical protein
MKVEFVALSEWSGSVLHGQQHEYADGGEPKRAAEAPASAANQYAADAMAVLVKTKWSNVEILIGDLSPGGQPTAKVTFNPAVQLPVDDTVEWVALNVVVNAAALLKALAEGTVQQAAGAAIAMEQWHAALSLKTSGIVQHADKNIGKTLQRISATEKAARANKAKGDATKQSVLAAIEAGQTPAVSKRHKNRILKGK